MEKHLKIHWDTMMKGAGQAHSTRTPDTVPPYSEIISLGESEYQIVSDHLNQCEIPSPLPTGAGDEIPVLSQTTVLAGSPLGIPVFMSEMNQE